MTMAPPSVDFIARKLAERDRQALESAQVLAIVKNIEFQVLRGRLTLTQALVTAEAARRASVDANTSVLGITQSLQSLSGSLRVSIERSRCIGKANMLGLLIVALLLVGAIAYFRNQAVAVEKLLSAPLQYTVIPVPGQVSIKLGEWRSGTFPKGESRCETYVGADRKPHDNPCLSWTQLNDASGPKQTLQELIGTERANNEVLLFIAGGHDRQPLRAALARRVGSNEQLGQLRADAVAKFLAAPPTKQGQPLRPMQMVVVSRGATDVASILDDDRTVVVTLMRLVSAGSARN